jgi:protoporphyrinogen oxidase
MTERISKNSVPRDSQASSVSTQRRTRVGIVGGGPAGLTAAYILTRDSDAEVTVLERDPRHLGGLSRTVEHRGYHFDIGGHRFFSKSREIEDLWTEFLPNDFLVRSRSSRIFYGGKFYSYPLKPLEALFKLGVFESARCVLSYLKRQLFQNRDPKSFKDWVSNQFGDRLFEIFFRTYTEKVWGMKCEEISSDWAAQRIKGLSLGSALRNAVLRCVPFRSRASSVKSLIESFRYPRKGPGMMWESCGALIAGRGGSILRDRTVNRLEWHEPSREWIVHGSSSHGQEWTLAVDQVISSAPLREVARSLSPPVAAEAFQSAGELKYRDFLTVVLIMEERNLFDDNWIYVHSPDVLVGRVQNFKSWSPDMVPDASKACFGLEYFCLENDDLWKRSDRNLIEMAAREFEEIGLGKAADVVDGCVVRQRKAYPVYDDAYQRNVEIVRREIEVKYPGLHLAGRNGMHKYNNQDHAMMTGILCAKNIMAGTKVHDPWKVNQDAEYHEEASVKTCVGGSGGLRETPTRVSRH